MLAGNYAPYNAGPGIWLLDVVIPLTILGLLFIRARLRKAEGINELPG